jgi:lysozyme
MKITDDCIDLIAHFEGLYLKAYLCPAKIWTIGIGTIRYPNGTPVREGDICTKEEAEEWMRLELEHDVVPAIERLVKVPLNDGQFGALCSLIYNIGQGNFAQSTLLKKLNAGNYVEAADQFLAWVKGGGRILPGLERRRRAERNMFVGKDWAEFKA